MLVSVAGNIDWPAFTGIGTLGLTAGAPATVRTERGTITLPVVIADLPDGVVWLPANSPGSHVRATLGAGHGDLVGVTA